MRQKYNRKQIVAKPTCDKVAIIKTNGIIIEKRENLKIELNKKGTKALTIIMMNPADADSNYSDATVNRVIQYFMNPLLIPINEHNKKIEDIKYINILNLFSICNSDSEKLYDDINTIISMKSEDYLQSIIDSNWENILKKLNDESDYVVLAWGMPERFPLPLYFEQAARVLKTLAISKWEIYVLRVLHPPSKKEYHLTTKHLNPPQPSNCKIIGLVRVDIKNFYRIIPRNYEELRLIDGVMQKINKGV